MSEIRLDEAGVAWQTCPNCGHDVVATAHGWRRHTEFCPITQLHQAVIEASVTGSSQGVLSIETRRKVDRAVAAIQQAVRDERTAL